MAEIVTGNTGHVVGCSVRKSLWMSGENISKTIGCISATELIGWLDLDRYRQPCSVTQPGCIRRGVALSKVESLTQVFQPGARAREPGVDNT